MSSNPKDVVEKFLRENGYPFEMIVAMELQNAGFDIYQSVYYIDLNTEVPREIDIVAIWRQKWDNKNFSIIFPIECKHAETPWVLFSSNAPTYSFCYTHSIWGQRWLIHFTKQPFHENFFQKEEIYGHSVRAAKKNSDQKDNAYAAVQMLISFLKSESRNPKISQHPDYAIYVPIVAIEGKLFETHLDKSRTMQINEVEQAQLIYKENIGQIIPKIHLVTKDGLKPYIGRLILDCRRIFENPYMHPWITDPSLILS